MSTFSVSFIGSEVELEESESDLVDIVDRCTLRLPLTLSFSPLVDEIRLEDLVVTWGEEQDEDEDHEWGTLLLVSPLLVLGDGELNEFWDRFLNFSSNVLTRLLGKFSRGSHVFASLHEQKKQNINIPADMNMAEVLRSPSPSTNKQATTNNTI